MRTKLDDWDVGPATRHGMSGRVWRRGGLVFVRPCGVMRVRLLLWSAGRDYLRWWMVPFVRISGMGWIREMGENLRP